jgi:hypothetical protein
VFEVAVDITMLKTMRAKIAINQTGAEFNFCSLLLLSKAMTVMINNPEYRTSNFGITKASNVNGAMAILESVTVRSKAWESKEPLLGDLVTVVFRFFPELI